MPAALQDRAIIREDCNIAVRVWTAILVHMMSEMKLMTGGNI